MQTSELFRWKALPSGEPGWRRVVAVRPDQSEVVSDETALSLEKLNDLSVISKNAEHFIRRVNQHGLGEIA